VATFVAALLFALRSCDSDRALVIASVLSAATGALAGGLLFIHRGRPAETFGKLLASALGALLVAVPVAGLAFVAMLVVALAHCGLD
jgi:hypothetical protein